MKERILGFEGGFLERKFARNLKNSQIAVGKRLTHTKVVQKP
ncbi:hypothetical protein [Trichormus variabilis]|nr:hypothetical protein [Trichormus variabilis]